jgi:pilus assembly protein TadC
MTISNIYRNYKEIVEFVGIKIPPNILLILMAAAVVVAFLVGAMFDLTLAILLSVLFFDIGLGLPFYLADRKVDSIESRLPDVLHHIGTTLKTGGTIEVALREVSRINYGPITDGLKTMLREINEGKTFEDAFSDFALISRSTLLKKCAVIIIAARRAGGGLLDTLVAMAEDVRALHRLKRERKTKTFMQFLFIIVAGCFIAPFIFGIVKSVLEILMKVGGTVAIAEASELLKSFDFLFKSYLIIASALTILCAVQVREGAASKSIVYIPIGVLVTYIIYIVVSSTFLTMLGGR